MTFRLIISAGTVFKNIQCMSPQYCVLFKIIVNIIIISIRWGVHEM